LTIAVHRCLGEAKNNATFTSHYFPVIARSSPHLAGVISCQPHL
jgi:hypothetical protein